ncbi:hypothetical protein RND71_035256 [Anisodus tanguticus]|uniref:Uncharacterized protein n=1 Tax=Anisodus tanguticus TaxID=243964 RepID=A0AAE1R474_9SOLA|nr:hypothetical protein RND71_035256 [Anisodus tanguticus]
MLAMNGTHILEPMGLEEHVRSGISTPKQPVANPDTPMIEEEIHGDAVGALAGKRTVVLSGLQALRCYSGETITHEIQPFGQEVSAEFTEGGHQEVSQDIQQISSRPAPDCFSDLASSEVRCGENQRLNSDNNSHMHKDEDRSNMPFRDIGRETLERKSYLAGYGSSSSPLLEDDSLNKDSYCSGMLLSLDDTSYKRTQLMLDYHRLPFLSRSVERWPSYLTSPSSNLDPVGDQKLLDRSRDYCYSRSISLHNKSSALPGCGTEPFSWTDLSGDMEHSCGYKTKVYFNDWEPSAPFQPSTFLSQIIPPPESLYDPICDSIEQTSTAEKESSANERKTADRAIAHQENMNTSLKEEKHSRPVNPRGQKRKQ